MGVGVMDGVRVMVGVNVGAGVSVSVEVGVNVGVGVSVQDSAVPVSAVRPMLPVVRVTARKMSTEL